ncbi:EcsC family protein [Faecalibacterium sp. An77]|uniref:EcsC family protein n=1 Tax=Faecalibacterium sp. An77 TaxID=1965655 RepID=UPI000B39BEC8|nr:EcsC family protein [Faecalibacterium sp. An77]OUN39328.1 EcsC family protein [Faecalibacterium sp. An77]
MSTKAAALTPDQIMQMLGKLYDSSIHGIDKISPPINKMADDYLQKYSSVEESAEAFIKYQIAKCTTSGFLAGLGGLITLPVAIPANVSSVLYVQMRMISCLAYMGGYDINSDQVQTLVYACLAGISIDQVLKQVGIQIGNKVAINMVKKIPGEVLIKINQRVGFRLFTKFGTKGLINIGKAVPVIGGVIGGGFDFVETKAIAHRAYKMFILQDFESDNADIT